MRDIYNSVLNQFHVHTWKSTNAANGQSLLKFLISHVTQWIGRCKKHIPWKSVASNLFDQTFLRSHPHTPGRYPGCFTNTLWHLTEFFLLGCLGKFGVSSQGIWAKSLNIWTKQSTVYICPEGGLEIAVGYHKTRGTEHICVTLANCKAQITPIWGYRVITCL